MKIFVLTMILVGLFGALKPASFTKTMKDNIDEVLKTMAIKRFKPYMIFTMILNILVVIFTYILIPIKPVQVFTSLTLLWSLFDFYMTNEYICKNRVLKLFDNKVYKFTSNVIDVVYFVFVVVYLIMHW